MLMLKAIWKCFLRLLSGLAITVLILAIGFGGTLLAALICNGIGSLVTWMFGAEAIAVAGEWLNNHIHYILGGIVAIGMAALGIMAIRDEYLVQKQRAAKKEVEE